MLFWWLLLSTSSHDLAAFSIFVITAAAVATSAAFVVAVVATAESVDALLMNKLATIYEYRSNISQRCVQLYKVTMT